MVLQKMTVGDLYGFVVDKVQLKIYRCVEDVDILNEPCDIVDLPDKLQKMEVIGLFPEKVGCLTIRVAPAEPEFVPSECTPGLPFSDETEVEQ